MGALIDDFYSQNDLIAYIQAGSFIGWLLEAHGRDALQRAWVGGVDALRPIDYDVARLERDWLRFLDERDAPGAIDWESIRRRGCD